jgi:hypothetical protein
MSTSETIIIPNAADASGITKQAGQGLVSFDSVHNDAFLKYRYNMIGLQHLVSLC